MYSVYFVETWNVWTADFKLEFEEYEKQRCNGGCKVSCQSMVHYIFALIHERSNIFHRQLKKEIVNMR